MTVDLLWTYEGSDGRLRYFRCRRCRGIVAEQYREKHAAWHARRVGQP